MQFRKCFISIVAFLPLLALYGCGSGSEEKSHDAMVPINKTKQVRIATDPPRLPFEYGLDTSVQGYDIDIGNEIAADLGVSARWVKIAGYDIMIEKLKNGEIEMVLSTIAPKPELEEDFVFSQPYFSSGDAIARRKTDSDIKDLASLSGKTVGVIEGRPGDAFMATQQTATGVTVSKFHNPDEALGALNRTEIDAVVGDGLVLTYSGYESFPNLMTIPMDMNNYPYVVLVRKSDQVLLESVNKTLTRLKESGALDASKEKWFQDVMEKAEADRIEQEEEDALKKAPKRINVRINKKSGSFKMDRLDGFVLELEGESGKYKSTPILTEGNRGNCRFTKPVPPGKYKLEMRIFQTTTTVDIQESPTDTLSMKIDYISDTQGIQIKVE